jgi:hypothetical protein
MPQTMKVGGKKRKLTPWIQAATAYWKTAKKRGMSYSKMLSSNEFRKFYKENYEGKKSGGGDGDEPEYDDKKEDEFPSQQVTTLDDGNEPTPSGPNQGNLLEQEETIKAEQSEGSTDIIPGNGNNVVPKQPGGKKKAKKSTKKSTKKSAKKSRKSKKRFFGLM